MCATLSWFVQRTVWPTFTVIRAGTNLMSRIATGTTAAGVGAGVAAGFAEPQPASTTSTIIRAERAHAEVYAPGRRAIEPGARGVRTSRQATRRSSCAPRWWFC